MWHVPSEEAVIITVLYIVVTFFIQLSLFYFATARHCQHALNNPVSPLSLLPFVKKTSNDWTGMFYCSYLTWEGLASTLIWQQCCLLYILYEIVHINGLSTVVPFHAQIMPFWKELVTTQNVKTMMESSSRNISTRHGCVSYSSPTLEQFAPLLTLSYCTTMEGILTLEGFPDVDIQMKKYFSWRQAVVLL